MINQGWIYREQIGQSDTGLTLLEYYTQKYPHSSQEEWLERILSGEILVNNKLVTPQTYLQAGQSLTYHRPPWEEPDVPLSFEVLYEDKDLLIISKPSGLPVLPGGGFLEHTLLWQLQQRYPHDKPVPIHRLGRGTSGLMLIARSPIARSNLTQQMRYRQISKVYRTLIGKSDLHDNFIIDHPIGKIPYPSLGYIYAATPSGKFAYSECQVLKRSDKNTILEVTILTGRPHQIRIHLATIGYPLLGDPLYTIGGIPKINDAEKLAVPGDCGYYLHAYYLAFFHPITKQRMNFTCPEPDLS
ncbi:RluA family pseudouridine synthase [Aphanothece sacrum]|uniref:Pseudouridine synthase n=1 Tax=Aphanothece sacrum FPU1 TaxID=1920663 RepID=A0A401IIR2_APHSA|nr:RluA family pseudouridine synthase [Aphanothece sacrum]GBF81202.1 pseudouridine synthase [Aphanothece sacrum FPU1]GBF83449.1 pseudouridine synthase [Aphanothece sacrum FPU3]